MAGLPLVSTITSCEEALAVLERDPGRELDALGHGVVGAFGAEEHALRARELKLIDANPVERERVGGRRARARAPPPRAGPPPSIEIEHARAAPYSVEGAP